MIRNGCPRDEFDFMEVIGAGSFGSVHRAVQKSSQKVVAIKIMKRKLESATECDHLLECKILQLLPSHVNIVKTYDIFFTPSNELHFVMEYMNGGNLYQLIKEKRDTGSFFTRGELRDIMQQTLAAVAHIHANHIFHRDLKPENLLLSTATGVPIIKLADFGLARETSSCPPYTEYVSTRWYRSPEVLLRSSNYSNAVDLWAIGTIFAELITHQPLFPGESEIDQLYRICQVLGSPGNKSTSSSISRKRNMKAEHRPSPGFARRKPPVAKTENSSSADLASHPYKRPSQSSTNTTSTISLLDGGGEWREGVKLAYRIGFEFPHLLPQPLADIVPGATPSMLDLLHNFLFFNPSQRLKAASALQHPFFTETDADEPKTIVNGTMLDPTPTPSSIQGPLPLPSPSPPLVSTINKVPSLDEVSPMQQQQRDNSYSSNYSQSNLAPPYIGKRRQSSICSILLDEPKLRKTDTGAMSMEIDKKDDQVHHTHRPLTTYEHHASDDDFSYTHPASIDDPFIQDDSRPTTSSKGANVGGERYQIKRNEKNLMR
ncbi:kinase-like domain-containing protein [Absidia repens]|uniref:Kinase-like domain-containing protein n=1 Tax=Absidia repens TaxID=90262 RepID=A0A1X2IE99_9FUNG|nr:kinase-like domain-containing protein [Absidia repens]